MSLVINNGQEYAQKGALEFSDVTVDETTGSITMRAVFPNPNKELMPGMFVRAILEDGVMEKRFWFLNKVWLVLHKVTLKSWW